MLAFCQYFFAHHFSVSFSVVKNFAIVLLLFLSYSKSVSRAFMENIE